MPSCPTSRGGWRVVLMRPPAAGVLGRAGGTVPLLDFFDLKGVVEALAARPALAGGRLRPASCLHLSHPGKAAEAAGGGRPSGSFGSCTQRRPRRSSWPAGTVLVGEFDLEAIQAAVPPRYGYTPVPRFPAALRDIAVIVEEAATADRVVAEARAAGGDLLLRGVRLFDLYHGESIPAGKKSLAYALTYQADDRTLTDKEVDKAHKKIEDRLKHVLKAQIRGKEMAH